MRNNPVDVNQLSAGTSIKKCLACETNFVVFDFAAKETDHCSDACYNILNPPAEPTDSK